MRRILGGALEELGSAPHAKLQFGKKTKVCTVLYCTVLFCTVLYCTVQVRRSRQSDIIPMIMEELPTRATRSQDDSQKVSSMSLVSLQMIV